MSRLNLLPPLTVALALRLSGLAWDGFAHQHPDERFLVMVTGELALPDSLGEVLDPSRTPLNPQNRGFGFFVYGALFPTLNLLAGQLRGQADYGGLLRSGRVLSTLFDGITLVLLALTARRLAGTRTASWLAWLYAFFPLAIQHARFGTVDALGLCAVALALFFALQKVHWSSALGAGLAVGLAAATRPNLASLALPVSLAFCLLPLRNPTKNPAITRLASLVLAGLAAFWLWKLADPGFFASALSPLPNPRRLASLQELAWQLAGYGQFPPNLQWVGRGPLFLLTNLFFWGLGPALGVAVLASSVGACRRLALGDRTLGVLLSWPLLLFFWQSRSFVVSVRHALPVVPCLLLVLALQARLWAPLGRTLVLGLTVPWGLAWAALAWQPYTRWEASQFLRQTLAPGAVIAVESWDDPLPLGVPPSGVTYREIPAYQPDTPEKREKLLAILQEAEVIALSSHRAVGSICRVPDAYPVMAEFYHLLFRGELGFRLVFSREVKLGWRSWGLSMLGAEEALSVYDHPPVWLFAKEKNYDHQQVAALLRRVRVPAETSWHTRELEARGLPPYQVRTAPVLPSPFSWPSNFWGQAASLSLWLVVFELMGVLGSFLLRQLSLPLPVAGLLGRPLGSLLVGLVGLWLGTLGIPGWRATLPLGLLLAALFFSRDLIRELLLSREAAFARGVFLVSWGLFLLVRAFNPEIYWGEKPMDAAILQVLLRSPALPPPDPWFAGYPINYYFFGFLPMVTAAELALAYASLAFNLATATVPALTSLAAAAGGWVLSGRRSGAVLAALLTQGLGTAHLVLHPSQLFAPNFNRFWESSRVIADTINEYPVWTALFADLHAHFLSFPGFCAAVALLLVFVSQKRLGRGFPWLVGAVLGAQFMSNSWEMPALGLLTLAAVVVRFRRKTRPWAQALSWLASVALAFALASAPYLMTQFFTPARVIWEPTHPPKPLQLLELYGIHATVFLLTLAWSFRLLAPPLRQFVGGVLALTLALILVPQYLTLADKMNTYFKLGLQAYLLLGVFSGGLWGIALKAPKTPGRRLVLRLASLVTAAGLSQSLWAAWAVTHTRWVPGPRPTLDGQAYLAAVQPSLASSSSKLRRWPVRAVAEPWAPAYGDTLRVPMFAGVPAVVGWEYHLWQRGKSLAEIRLRAADVDRILQSPQDPLAVELTRRWDVDLLVRWDQPPPKLAGFTPEGDGAVLVRIGP